LRALVSGAGAEGKASDSIMMNRLITISIKVNIHPTAIVRSVEQGTCDEEGRQWPGFLELALGLGLEQHWKQRLSSFQLYFF
jgi:hypothetical protein